MLRYLFASISLLVWCASAQAQVGPMKAILCDSQAQMAMLLELKFGGGMPMQDALKAVNKKAGKTRACAHSIVYMHKVKVVQTLTLEQNGKAVVLNIMRGDVIAVQTQFGPVMVKPTPNQALTQFYAQKLKQPAGYSI